MSSSISIFCQWLLHDPSGASCPTAIVFHGSSDIINDELIQDIAAYLNEYDDLADGSWLGADNSLLEDLHNDPTMRKLLGFEEDQIDRHGAVILKRLAEQGNLVFQMPTGPVDLPSLSRSFHVGVGQRDDIAGHCHITVDPSLTETGRLPQIVADVFLEWNYSHRHPKPTALGA